MIICKLCNLKVCSPYNLNCGHIFCTSCLQKLPTKKCVECMNDNVESNIYWVYSSNIRHYWWGYDINLNYQIENIYNDYLIRHNIDSPTHVKQKFKKKQKQDELDIKIMMLDNDNSINFENNENNEDNEENEEIVKIKDDNSILSYNIFISNNEYVINFDHMKQISVINSNKKRNIKRIIIPNHIKNIENYLKNECNIIGMSGNKFNEHNNT
jgi:hypothetical protein